jgi:hypothetical protein
MLRRVVLLRINVSEVRIVSIITVTRIGELGKTLVVTGNRRTLRRGNSEGDTFGRTSVLTKAKRRCNPEYAIRFSTNANYVMQ